MSGERRARPVQWTEPTVLSFDRLMDLQLPPVRWVIPGILPEGVTLLAGKAKVRKSWFALGLCIAVASGGAALGKIRVERGEALYCALEDNHRRLQSRGRKVLGSSAAPEGFYYATDWPRLDEGGVGALRRWLEQHPDCRLVVIDTLAKVRPRPRNSSGGYQEDYEALEELLPLAAERGVAILVVTHTRKAGATDVLDEINATTGLMGGVDGFLVFRVERGKNEATMHVEGRDIEEPGEYSLKWDRELHGWMLAGHAEEQRLTDDRRAVLDLLREATKPLPLKIIAAALGKSTQAVSNLLAKLAVDGRVKSAGYGRWQLTPPITGSGESSEDSDRLTYGDSEKDSPLSPLTPVLEEKDDLFSEDYAVSSASDLMSKRFAEPIAEGFVYVVRGDGLYKIGRSADPEERARRLDYQMPFDVELVDKTACDNCEAGERAAHERFANKRAWGEWFRLSGEDIDEVARIARSFNAGAISENPRESGVSDETPLGNAEKHSSWGGTGGESSLPAIKGWCKHDVRGGCHLCRKRTGD